MAAGMLSAPGTQYGPCKEKCRHTDCAALRKTAESNCTICNKAIGYENAFYAKEETYVHALCEEQRIKGDQ